MSQGKVRWRRSAKFFPLYAVLGRSASSGWRAICCKPQTVAGGQGATPEAARTVRPGERGPAAIVGVGSRPALYGLQILARNIEDEAKNTTRFLVIASHDAAPSGKDKTSLILATRNVPGAIHELLTPLARPTA